MFRNEVGASDLRCRIDPQSLGLREFSCEAPGLAAVPLTARNICGSRHFKFVVGGTRIAKNAPESDLNPIRTGAEDETRPPPWLFKGNE